MATSVDLEGIPQHPASATAEEARRRVLEYVAARNKWEHYANRRSRESLASGSHREALHDIQRGYEALQAAYCTQRLLARQLGGSFGDPPSFDIKNTRIKGVTVRGQAATVSTHEDNGFPGGDDFEYILRHDGARWLIDDRRSKDDRGRWVRGLL